MNTRKTVISSVLANDFGIEDFQNGTVMNRGSEDIASYNLSNKLGLLAPLADRADTEVVTFGSEAYDLLGEAKQLEQYATQQITAVNQRFAIAAEIKKGYGVEGFDAFAFGCEGFKETMKNAFTAVVAAIKKVIQSITNWIRQVMNWVGSQFAKGQAKLVEKYNGKLSNDATVTIKAIVPAKPIKSGADIIDPINKGITSVGQLISAVNKVALTALENGFSGSKDLSLKYTQGVTSASSVSFGKTVVFDTFYGKHIDVLKIGTASKVANEIVWGSQKPQKITVSALNYLTKATASWQTILGKDDLKNTQKLVSYGKALIKVLNESLKTADKLAKQMMNTSKAKTEAQKNDKKAANDQVKATRRAIAMMNNCNRIGSLSAGILYGSFAGYLKLRSYVASAVRALAKDARSSAKPAKEGSRKDNLAKARQAING